jgi:F-box and leucine-rich repeat protein 10/11
MVRMREYCTDAQNLWMFLRYCATCLEADKSRSITLKAPARKSHRKRSQRDYANLNAGMQADPKRWLRMMEGKPIHKDHFKRMKGSDVTMQWLSEDSRALEEPIVIETPDGLDMKMPSPEFTISDVAKVVGEEMPLEVMGTSSS